MSLFSFIWSQRWALHLFCAHGLKLLSAFVA